MTGNALFLSAVFYFVPDRVMEAFARPVRLLNVPSSAMAPTLEPGTIIGANNTVYLWRDVVRGEVIAYRPKPDEDTLFVGRVVGLGGEVLRLKGNRVIVDGEELTRRRVGSYRMRGREDPVHQFEERTPEGRKYRVVNFRLKSEDEQEQVFQIPAGSLFVMGDNRDDSWDSRSGWNGNHFIPKDRVESLVYFRFHPVGRPRIDPE